MLSLIVGILLCVIGVGLIIYPILQFLSCNGASDITWTLGQRGGMRNGIFFYLIMFGLGAAALTGGLILCLN